MKKSFRFAGVAGLVCAGLAAAVGWSGMTDAVAQNATATPPAETAQACMDRVLNEVIARALNDRIYNTITHHWPNNATGFCQYPAHSSDPRRVPGVCYIMNGTISQFALEGNGELGNVVSRGIKVGRCGTMMASVDEFKSIVKAQVKNGVGHSPELACVMPGTLWPDGTVAMNEHVDAIRGLWLAESSTTCSASRVDALGERLRELERLFIRNGN
jgi:hypothetical protein